MYLAHQTMQQLDARQLMLDADLDALSVSDSTLVEMARQWAIQVGTWLGAQGGQDVFHP
jgi:hypothetical protein